MSINDHSEWYKNGSHTQVEQATSLQASHCSFSTLFAYELWIENWDCDFDHLSLQFRFSRRFFWSLSKHDC